MEQVQAMIIPRHPHPHRATVTSLLTGASLALCAAGGFFSGCRSITNVYISGPPPNHLSIYNDTFLWRSSAGVGASNVSNRVEGGAALKVTP